MERQIVFIICTIRIINDNKFNLTESAIKIIINVKKKYESLVGVYGEIITVGTSNLLRGPFRLYRT